jgi:intracellular septation protein
MQFLLEYAPIILFFVAYKLKDIYFATGVAIVASILAIAYAWLVTKKVTSMQWVSLAIIVIFGGATLLLHDEVFIKWKPTALYAVLGLTLLFGKLVMKKNWIGVLFKQANIEAPAAVWTRVTWAWVVFFAFMAALNAYVATNFSLDAWVNFKVWWAMGIFFVFTIGNVLFLSRYISETPAAAAGAPATDRSSDTEPKP